MGRSSKPKAESAPLWQSRFFISLLLILATLAVYWPVKEYGFSSYDDSHYIVENPHIQHGITLDGIRWAFSNGITTSIMPDLWIPVTYLSHMATIQFFGMNPAAHHLVNLGFHLLNTLLLFFLLLQMTRAKWQSAFVAILFAVHPLHVESVVWIVERKDVLSTFFWFLSLWAYIRYCQRPTLQMYLLVCLTFILGLWSKTILVTLPFLFLLLDYWPLGRLPLDNMGTVWKRVREKLPLMALSVAFTAIPIISLPRQGMNVISAGQYSLLTRLGNALASYVSYLRKMFWPSDLAVFYPHPGYSLPAWQIGGSFLLLVCVSILVLRARKKQPYLAVGWFWYLGTLLPAMGLVPTGAHLMADRYTYVPLIGIFIMIAWGAPELLAGLRQKRSLWIASSLIVVSAVMVSARQQLNHWRTNIALYEHAIRVTKNNFVAHNNLGTALKKQGEYSEAVAHFAEAVRIYPRYSDAHSNWGASLIKEGKFEEAKDHLNRALQITPNMADAHNNLGVIFKKKGNLKEAVAHYAEAVRLTSHDPESRNNLAIALSLQNKFPEAVEQFNEVLEIFPYHAKTYNNLGVTLERQGKVDEAISHYLAALKLSPDYREARKNLSDARSRRNANPNDPSTQIKMGVVLIKQGKLNEAVSILENVLKNRPNDSNAHSALGFALAQQGKLKEAAAHFGEARRIRPDDPQARFNLGVAYTKLDRLDDAILEFKAALELDPNNSDARRNLEITTRAQNKRKGSQ